MQPPFLSVPVHTSPADAAGAAVAAAAAEPGQVFWRADVEALDCAIVILPEPAAAVLAGRALSDALGALGPPHAELAVEDEAVRLNGATVGVLRVEAAGPLALLLLSLRLADTTTPDPGLTPDRSTLRDEGFDAGIDAEAILDAFLRHLLFHSHTAEEGASP
ncbi:biotin/lipoate--protein ligase family protein [Novispirillum sp. DQ9]|uniref:biotin/lipoate--protein ligase family protein n=1 Tax=Novispirillum sp. DQ9 TaxID=3398612 RepID=UPI003C7D7E48